MLVHSLGMMADACNPSTLGDQGRWITWGQEFETSLANMVKPHLYQKYKNYPGVVAHAWNPATGEAEAGESLEPKRQRLLWAKITPLHSSLGNKSETDNIALSERNKDISQTLQKLTLYREMMNNFMPTD